MAIKAIRKKNNKIDPDTYVKIGMFVVGGLAIGFGVKKVLDYFKPDRKREESEQKTTINELDEAKKKTPLTYPQSQYANFANIIETAGFDLGTDEEAIYSVFRNLRNDADYLALATSWGKPTRKIYDFGRGYNVTLPQYIRWEMNAKEAAKVNAILKSKKIKYRV
jgi:hypothetical protein